MLGQDETDKPLIAIWIPEAMEWSMLGSNTKEGGIWTKQLPPLALASKRLKQNNWYPNPHKQLIYTYNRIELKHWEDWENKLYSIYTPQNIVKNVF